MSDKPNSPELCRLDAFIQSSVAKLLSADQTPGNGVLFLGNWHDAMPRLVFLDPVLQPVDTRVWGVVKIASADGGPTAFPTYRTIARQANVGSEATVARALAILRITRWLSLCRRVRDEKGRFRGNIYALHDEPLTLSDATSIDAHYLAFLTEACDHAHPRVRSIATAMLNSIDEEARRGSIASTSALHRLKPPLTETGEPFFGFTARQLQKLKSGEIDCLHPHDQLQYLKSDSSSCINRTTTTEQGKEDSDEVTASKLVFPELFDDNDRRLAHVCLRGVDTALRQDVLDELAGRIIDGKRNDSPISNPIGYLAKLAKAAREGAFVFTSFGLRMRDGRTRAQQIAKHNDEAERKALARLEAQLDTADGPALRNRVKRGGKPS